MHAREQAENAIIRTALESLIAVGHEVAIWNGESWSLYPTADVETLLASLRQADVDVLHLAREGVPTGSWVLLVYGNDPFEVLADWTVDLSPLLESALKRALQIEAAGER